MNENKWLFGNSGQALSVVYLLLGFLCGVVLALAAELTVNLTNKFHGFEFCHSELRSLGVKEFRS